MLDWLTANQQSHYAEDSGLIEAPETPAPVFALRAFKGLFQASPSKDGQTLLPPGAYSDITDDKCAGNAKDAMHHEIPPVSPSKSAKRPRKETLARSSRGLDGTDSPMKSILLSSPRKVTTPGTKKKNVSFREALQANKRDKRRAEKLDSLRTEDRANLPNASNQCNATEVESGPKTADVKMSQIPKAKGAPKADPVAPSERNVTSTPKDFENQEERSPPSHIELNGMSKTKTTDTGSEHQSGPSHSKPPSTEGIVQSPDDVADYISRTNREAKKLVRAIKSMRSYARNKDQEASQLRAQMAAQLAENKKLQAENQAMKKKLKSLEAKLAVLEPKCSSNRRDRRAMLGPDQDNASKTSPERRKNPVRNITAPVPSVPVREKAPNVANAEIMSSGGTESRNDTPPMRLSSANGRVRMAPDRLEAAKARLRVKSEERKKAWSSPGAEKENEKENA